MKNQHNPQKDTGREIQKLFSFMRKTGIIKAEEYVEKYDLGTALEEKLFEDDDAVFITIVVSDDHDIQKLLLKKNRIKARINQAGNYKNKKVNEKGEEIFPNKKRVRNPRRHYRGLYFAQITSG